MDLGQAVRAGRRLCRAGGDAKGRLGVLEGDAAGGGRWEVAVR